MDSFFDCNCMIGRRKVLNPGSFYTVEELVRKMQHYGIRKALVYHSMAREYNPIIGNTMLMNEITLYPELYPVWVVMPSNTREFYEVDDLIEQMKKNNIRAARMFPAVSEQNYSIEEWNCGELFSSLEMHGRPLFIGMDQISWKELHDLCESHSKLKIILIDVNYRIDRNLYGLFNKFEHLYIETAGYKTHWGIEEICKNFGAQRLVFGSGMPIHSGGSAVSMINYANITQEEKSMIAYKNLENILGM